MPQSTRRKFLLQSAAGAACTLAPVLPLRGEARADAVAWLTVAEVAGRIRQGTLRSEALVQALLTRVDALNPKLDAFITVRREQALQEAAALDAEARQGRFRGPLHGVPVAIKDNIDTAGTRTTVGSMVFDDRVPTADAFVVSRLRAAGALVLGKSNLHEFAMGGTSATSYFGPVHNPWALERVAGGSSGGSAAAVAAGLVPAALGTDTGGSIRIPAAWCGVVGLKPTYGLVSLGGIFPLIYSLDHCGPMARTVEDAALMLNVMAGYDKHDVASVEHAPEDYVQAMRQPVSGLRVGVPRAPFFDKLDAATAAAVETAIGVIKGLVQSVRDVQLPAVDALDWTAVRAAEVAAVHQDLFRRHAGNYQLQTRGVVDGTFKELNDPGETAAGKAVDLIRAQWHLAGLRKTIDDAFDGFDLVVLPTNRVGPRTIQEELGREEKPQPEEPTNDFNSLAFNLYGIPAISIPCGFTPGGLPVGLMIAGPRFSEGRVLALAAAYERAAGWGSRRPAIASL
ncbi:amidase [Terriglobus aquaticus]|uniref:Amidase n=1 Tax=Terriglobus aquaticus TaxID=940139 RepID=A0ABW9KHC0_9BACT|nr:amidase [Terriglobus aquaticus]